MRILAVNAGSTGVKLSVVGDNEVTEAERTVAWTPDDTNHDAVLAFAAASGEVGGVCHRIVHGGPALRHAVVVDDAVRRQLGDAAVFAPLHVPRALQLLDLLRGSLRTPAVACFDTTFHAAMPKAASTFAIPVALRELGVQRYGFHGLSCAWSLRQAAQRMRRHPDDLQLLIAHLGGGCSVTAVRDGHGVDTTMSFSPLDGLVMATRSGSLDPAAVLWLQTAHHLSPDALTDQLEHDSGLLALTGSDDMLEVERRAEQGDASASFALDVFVHHVRRGIAAVAASLDRVDALVFTGGIGENSETIRRRVVAGGMLGQAFPGVLTVHAREDLQMAAEARALLG